MPDQSSSRISLGAAALLLLVASVILTPLGMFVFEVVARVTGGNLPAQVLVSPDPLSDSVAATAAEFRVDESGAATYKIPLYTVPGTAGVKPEISLVYSSQGGYGPVGRGWSIGGLSSIARCRATRETGDFLGAATPDGTPRPINFGSTDRFCLDGQRLVPSTATCPSQGGMSGVALGTEIETFARVCAYTAGGATTGPAFFTVERKDGSLSWYGDRDSGGGSNRPDGYFETTSPLNPGAALVWAQTRFQDSTGNYIDYLYSENPAGPGTGEHLISEIRYTGRVALAGQARGASPPFARVVFNYSDRPVTQWARTYVSGGVVTQSRRLASVTSCGSLDCEVTQQARHYVLSYQNSLSGSGQETLTGFQECRDNRAAVCASATSFEWSPSRHDFATEETPANVSFGNRTDWLGFKMGDVDGDGRLDIVYLRRGGSGQTCTTQYVVVAFSQLDASGGQSFAFGPQNQCTPASIDLRGDGAWHLLDYDGDGRDDLLVSAGTGQGWRLYRSTGRGGNRVFDEAQNLIAGVSPIIPSDGNANNQPQLADLNGDGLLDIVYPRNGTMYARLSGRQAAGFSWGTERSLTIDTATLAPSDARCSTFGWQCARSVTNAPVSKDSVLRFADFNGDGAADLLLQVMEVGINGWTGETFHSPSLHVVVVADITSSAVQTTAMTYLLVDGRVGDLRLADLNGDGLSDLLFKSALGGNTDWQYWFNSGRQLIAGGTLSFGQRANRAQFVDVNGDGRADVLTSELTADYSAEIYHARLSLPNNTFAQPAPLQGGRARICDGASKPWNVNPALWVACPTLDYAPLFADLDGDGNLDFLSLKLATASTIYVSRPTERHTPRDVIVRVTNGFGASTRIGYAPLTNSAVYRRSTGSLNSLQWGRGSPVVDTLASTYVVAAAWSSSPQAGAVDAQASVHYRYSHARGQAGGRGFLGFAQVETIDPNHDAGYVTTATQYAQNFPFIGVPVRTTKKAVLNQAYLVPSCLNGIITNACFATPGTSHPDLGGSWFSDSAQSWEMAPASLAAQTPIHVRTMGTEESLRDPYTGELTSKVATAFSYGSHGNVTQTVVDTYTGASTLTGTQITQNTYSDDVAKWRLGRLTGSTITHRRPGQPDIVRTTGFSHAMGGAGTGLLTEERTQPGGAADLASATTYLLDDFGNRVQSTTCAAPATGCSVAGFQFHPTTPEAVKRYSRVEYDAQGRFPVATFEPFWSPAGGTEVQTSRILARNVFGDATEVLDVNNVRTVAVAGGMGRPYFAWTQTTPNATPGNGGATSLTTYRWCSGTGAVACPVGARFREQVSATASPRQWTYLDLLGRPVMKAVETFNANVGGQDVSAVCTEYDGLGRARRTSTPFFLPGTSGMEGPSDVAGACTSASRNWTTTTYDILGRPTRVQGPDGSQVTSTYAGLVTTTRDARNNPSTQTRNGKGEVISTQDATGFITQFGYNAAGNLTTISRNAGTGTITNSFGYDVLGRKTLQVDPDTGTTTFQYNALGELIAQTDNGGYRTEREIDARGRAWRVSAKLPGGAIESQSTSTFDTAPYGIGQLAEESVAGQYAAWAGQLGTELSYRRNMVFDAMGRAIKTETTVDGQVFSGNIAYDTLGRPWKAQDASGAWVKTQYGSRGAVAICASSPEDTNPSCPTGPDTYQRTLATDAWGNVVHEARADNASLEVRRQYHALTGRIAEICGGNIACNLVKEAYVWDAAGNLASHQKEGRYLEGFTYDSLNRVTEGRLTMANGVTVNQVMLANAYDALGNVCSKNGVGYAYPGADGCVGAVPMAQSTGIPVLASVALPRYQQATRSTPRQPRASALNRGQMRAPERSYRRYSDDDRPSWDDEAEGWTLGEVRGDAVWRRNAPRPAGRTLQAPASAPIPSTSQQLSAITASSPITMAAVSSVASSPHAVNQVGSGTSASFYYYDDRGNQTLRDAPGSSNDRTIRYSADGKAHEIQMGSGQTTRFWYGPDGQRYKRQDGTTTTYYIGGVEVLVQNGMQTARRYVAGVALQTVINGVVQATRFMFHDHLGSLVRIANVDGSVAEALDYTAFGDRRAYGNPGGTGSASTLTPRGFTGHEYVDGTQVIHMNGRIYDQQLGRFLQPDPVIQEPTNAQSWNAYTYVFNNPLAYTDPTGYMSFRQILGLVIAIVGTWVTQGMDGGAFAKFGMAMAFGAASGYVATGTFRGAVIGAVTAGVTAGTASFVQGMTPLEQMFNMGVTGGVMESLQGGSFGSGFASAGLTAMFMPQLGGYKAPTRVLGGALVGGTISAATGGKFANGAVSGAIQGAMMSVPSVEEPTTRNRNHDVNRKLAKALRQQVNNAIDAAGVSSFGYDTVDDAADAWWGVVGPMGLEHEVGAGIFLYEGKYYVGRSWSSGSRHTIWGASATLGSSDFVGYVHNHPDGGPIRLSGDEMAYTFVPGAPKLGRSCGSGDCSGDVSFAMHHKLTIYAFNPQGRQSFNAVAFMGQLHANPYTSIPVSVGITTKP